MESEKDILLALPSDIKMLNQKVGNMKADILAELDTEVKKLTDEVKKELNEKLDGIKFDTEKTH